MSAPMGRAPFPSQRGRSVVYPPIGPFTRSRRLRRYVSPRCGRSFRVVQGGHDVKLAVIFDNFTDPGSGLDMLARWLHVLAGIAWIGLLYFFNFVQTPSFAELSPGARNEAFDKLTWRALWWFRWAAMATFLMGLVLLGLNASSDDTFWGGKNYLATARGTAILTGILFGLTMLANVWMIIWPNQQVVIGSV